MIDPQDPKLPPGISQADVDEAKRVIARCWVVAGLVVALPLEQLDKWTQDAESWGPILYPDIWRTNAAKIMEDRQLIRVLAQLRRDVLVSNPNLTAISDIVEAAATEARPVLDAAFRDVFGRGAVARLPPLAILTGLVRYIARLAPHIKG